MLAPAELSENIEEKGSGKIGGGTPGSERDPIRARSRIVGVLDSLSNGLQGWVKELVVVDPFGVVPKEVGTL